MHLVALYCDDPVLAEALSQFRHDNLNIHLHPIPANKPLERVLKSLEPLDMAGALILSENLQEAAYGLADRRSLDAQEVLAADTITVTPGGLIAEYNYGRAAGAALAAAGWHPRGARVVIFGSGFRARALSRELASQGVKHLSVLAKDRPRAEQVAERLAANTETLTEAQSDSLARSLVEQADLIVRLEPTVNIKSTLLGPHLTVLDLVNQPLSKLRQNAMKVGALTLGARDVQVQQVVLSLGHMLGGRIPSEALSDLLHSL